MFRQKPKATLKEKLQNYVFKMKINQIIGNIYYKKLIILDQKNNPQPSKFIIYTNHHNLFLDAWIAGYAIKGIKNLIISMKTHSQRIMGTYSRLSGNIPIQQAKQQQDGRILKVQNNLVYGQSTNFKSLKLDQKISFDNGEPIKIKKIISSQLIQLQSTNNEQINIKNIDTYYVHTFNGYEIGFQKLHQKLQKNQEGFIFPQGDYDMSQYLFRFKHGGSKMILQYITKYNDNTVQMCLAVYHHYASHIWRSTIVLDIYPLFLIPQSIIQLYKKSERQGINELTVFLKQKMQEKFIEIPNSFSMITITLMRKIITYQKVKQLQFKDKIQVNRQLSKAVKQQVLDNKENLTEMAQQLNSLYQRCVACGQNLKKKQKTNPLIQLIKLFIYALILLFLCLIILPGGLLFSLPTYFVIKFPQDLRKFWQKKSEYRYKRYDLIASFRVIYGFGFYAITHILAFLSFILINCLILQNQWICSLINAILWHIGFFFYCYIMIKCYDEIQNVGRKIKYSFSFIFKSQKLEKINNMRQKLNQKIINLLKDKHSQQWNKIQQLINYKNN